MIKSIADFGTRKPPPGIEPPTLEKAADGTASLTFFMLQFGKTGSATPMKAVLTVAPGYQTQLRLEPMS